MKMVRFPNGRQVPALGQGSWHLGQGKRSASKEVEALQTGVDLGLTLIDTAEMYGEGRSEKLIGSALISPVTDDAARRREALFMVSKVYPHHARRQQLRRACDKTLAFLGVEQLDLYLLHWRGGADLAEVVAGFESLRDDGKIGAWGVSNFDVDDMEDLFKIPGGEHCATNQVLYNPSSRGIEFDLLPWCTSRGMPLMAYSPLGSGSDLLHHPALAKIAERHASSAAAVALSWAMRHGNIIAIPEAGDTAHVRANAQALHLSLDEKDLADLDAAFPPPRQKMPLDIL